MRDMTAAPHPHPLPTRGRGGTLHGRPVRLGVGRHAWMSDGFGGDIFASMKAEAGTCA